MTFSILGHCPRTDQIGIAYTTVTLAGGGISPTYTYGGDIVVVQAYGNQTTATAAARALDRGADLDEVQATMERVDADFSHRQIGIMTRDGASRCLTGADARPWKGHIVGDDVVAMGNVLVGSQVVEALAEAFAAEPDQPLADRLLSAIEAGRDAGGQQAPENRRYNERSALLRVHGDGPDRREAVAMDLRVDMTVDAVDELRRMYEIYRPVVKRRSERARNPADDLPTAEWEQLNMTDKPPPPALR